MRANENKYLKEFPINLPESYRGWLLPKPGFREAGIWWSSTRGCVSQPWWWWAAPYGEGKKSPFAEGNEEFYSVNRTKSISLVSNMGWMETNTREKKKISVVWEWVWQKRVTKCVFTKAKKKKNIKTIFKLFSLLSLNLVWVFSAFQWWVGVSLLSKDLRAKGGSWLPQNAPRALKPPKSSRGWMWLVCECVCECETLLRCLCLSGL